MDLSDIIEILLVSAQADWNAKSCLFTIIVMAIALLAYMVFASH